LRKIFFFPSLLLLFLNPESEIWDPGSGIAKNQDPDKYPGSATLYSVEIKIPYHTYTNVGDPDPGSSNPNPGSPKHYSGSQIINPGSQIRIRNT
jgi:hypothetical protein